MIDFEQLASGQSVIENRFSEMGINLDDEAARILTSSAHAIQVIRDRRAKLDQAGQHDVPLIVFGGEYHAYPGQIFHHMAVVNGISKSEKTAFCTEITHNQVESMFKTLHEGRLPKQSKAALKNLDRAGALSLETAIGLSCMAHSPYANKILQNFLLDQEIPTRFTDVAHDGMYLDSNDESTRASIRRCFNALSNNSGIDVMSRMGMRIRNDHMMGHTMEHIKNHGARIVFFKGGTDHMIGEVGAGYPAKESLSAIAKGEGAAVLAMPVVHENMHVPLAHGLTEEEFFPIAEFSGVVTNYNPWTDEPLKGHWRQAVLKNTAEEMAYVNGLLARTGFEDRVLNFTQYGELVALKRDKMLYTFVACESAPSMAL